MKYGVIPVGLFERVALALGRVPVPALDSLYGPIKARAILAAVRLGLFTALQDGWRTSEALAAQLRVDASTLDQLLRVLVVAGYVDQRGAQYALSKLARRSFVRGGGLEMTGFVQWNHWMWDMIARLEDVVRTGHGIDYHAGLDDPEAWKAYQRAMLEIARLDAPWVARQVPVRRGATRLLDVAGAHGLFGASVCARHPALRATVLELPRAVEAARALAREEGIDDRVVHQAGDLLHDDWGGDWDVVLLANILHHFVPADVGAILGRAHAGLRPGGTIAIWEIERPARGSKATDGDGAALFFRITSTAGAYHGDEYTEWLRAAGFRNARPRRRALSPGKVLVTASL